MHKKRKLTGKLTINTLCALFSINLHTCTLNSLSSLPSHSTRHPFVFVCSARLAPALAPLLAINHLGSTKLLLVRRQQDSASASGVLSRQLEGRATPGGGIDAHGKAEETKGQRRTGGRIPSRSLSGLEKPI